MRRCALGGCCVGCLAAYIVFTSASLCVFVLFATVCIKVVETIYSSVPEDSKKDKAAIEDAIDAYCKRAHSKGKDRLGSKERKACYYMVDIKRKVSDPLARGLPAKRVCNKLKKANAELCEMRFRTPPPAVGTL